MTRTAVTLQFHPKQPQNGRETAGFGHPSSGRPTWDLKTIGIGRSFCRTRLSLNTPCGSTWRGCVKGTKAGEQLTLDDLHVHATVYPLLDHARYSHVTGISYAIKDTSDIRLAFGTITKESPLLYLLRALKAIHKELCDTILVVETMAVP